jgi:TolA-binding protein
MPISIMSTLNAEVREMKIGAANSQKASASESGGAKQIENQIRVLREQLSKLRANDKIDEDEKAKKIRELEKRIAALQEKLAKARRSETKENIEDKAESPAAIIDINN